MKGIALVLFSSLTLLSCATGRMKDPHRAGLATGQPRPNVSSAGDPGETTPVPRSFKSAPPVVPHAVQGFTIDRRMNDCVDCHVTKEEVTPGHTPKLIPASHFENPFTGEKHPKGGTVVAGLRNNCLQCHVTQTD